MKSLRYFLLIFNLILTGCARPAQAVAPTSIAAIPSVTLIPPTETATEAPTVIPATPTAPNPTADPTIFGAIGTGEIQAFALESVASAIFQKTMDGFIADGRIQEYQVTSVIIFPGGNGLIAELICNVRTTDPGWIAEGGTPADNHWLNAQCYRFDFFTTDTEYQLKNRRLCS